MLRRMAPGCFLEKRLQRGHLDRGTVQEQFLCQVAFESFKCDRGILWRHPRLPALLTQPDRQLDSVDQLHLMKPSHWKPRSSFAFRQSEKFVCLGTFRE